MGFFKPAWMINDIKNIKKRDAAIVYVKQAKPEELREIAVKAPSPFIREEAIRCLKDPDDLVKILGAVDDKGADQIHRRLISMATAGNQKAVSAIRDEDMSVAVLKNRMSEESFQRLKQKAIPDITTLSADQMYELFNNVSDPQKLKDIALNAENEAVRFVAARNLNDPVILRDIALNAENQTDQFNAAILISDPEVCMQILASDTTPMHARDGALYNFSDEKLLDIINSDDMPDDSRTAAAHRLFPRSNGTLSFDAFLLDEKMPAGVKRQAVQNTDNQELLEKIALSDEELDIRKLSLEKIRDNNFLKKIRDEIPIPELRDIACERTGHEMVFLCEEEINRFDTVAVSYCRICGKTVRTLRE